MDEINNSILDAFATTRNLQQPFASPLNISSDHQTISLTKCTSQESQRLLYQRNPRKRRSKLVKVRNRNRGCSGGVSKPKISKKLAPFAPKITTPCSVCGKRFWSWKALFGHMRCHPERQWRGINPPSHQNSDGVLKPSSSAYFSDQSKITEEEYAVAEYLLLLANGPTSGASDHSFRDLDSDSDSCGLFECSRFKKVLIRENGNNNEVGFGHRCGNCFGVFSGGQALGGHMKCHMEKDEGSSALISLNLPAAADDSSPRSCLSALDLDF